MILRRSHWLLALALICAAQVAYAADADKQIRQAREKSEELGADLQRLEARYINPALLEHRYEIQTRINDGRVFYLLRDYTRASIIFLDLVNNDEIKGTPAQRDSLFYLADSLFLNGNSVGARRHFNELLSVGAAEYYQDAVKRLIEIASQLDDFDNVENLYRAARARSGNKPIPGLIYVYGKSLFFQNKLEEALTIFAQIPAGDELEVQSQYFRGVIQAKLGADSKDEGRLRAALRDFDRVLELIGPTPADPNLINLQELAHLSLGRIYYEMGEFELAVDQYQYIERTSPRFDRALYEVTWTFIRRGELALALHNLDILLLTAPDSALAPEARLLRGDLMIQNEDYPEAVSTYQKVIAEYEPVRAELKAILEREGGTRAYFDVLVGRKSVGARSVEVPEIVRAWVDADPRMARTLLIARDLDSSARDIEESRELIAELEDAINSRSRIDIFPELKEGWGRGLEVQNSFIEIKRDLLNLEAKMVMARADAGAKERYKAVRAERERLGRRFSEIPGSRAELARRERSVKGQYSALEDELFRMSIELDSMRAQLVAMDKYIKDITEAGDPLPADVQREVSRSRDEFEAELRRLEAAREALRRDVRRTRAQTGINDDVAEQEDVLKKDYQAALARERQLLASMRGGLSGDDARRAGAIDEVIEKVLGSEARLDSYFSKINRIVSTKVKEIRRLIDIEKVRVGQYAEELAAYTGEGDTLSGEIAQDNFRRVDAKFEELILKADVGIIDVAWKRKEDRSNRIKELFEHQANDLKTLDQNFRGVLEAEE